MPAPLQYVPCTRHPFPSLAGRPPRRLPRVVLRILGTATQGQWRLRRFSSPEDHLCHRRLRGRRGSLQDIGQLFGAIAAVPIGEERGFPESFGLAGRGASPLLRLRRSCEEPRKEFDSRTKRPLNRVIQENAGGAHEDLGEKGDTNHQPEKRGLPSRPANTPCQSPDLRNRPPSSLPGRIGKGSKTVHQSLCSGAKPLRALCIPVHICRVPSGAH